MCRPSATAVNGAVDAHATGLRVVEKLLGIKSHRLPVLGTGYSRGVLWRGIEVVRSPGGPPQLRFHGGAARFERLVATGSPLALTHSRDLAIAHVLLLRE